MGGFGAGRLSWAAGVGEADLAAGGEGALGLAGFLGQQPAAFRRVQQPLVDLAVVEGACRSSCGSRASQDGSRQGSTWPLTG
jgi:hypothetical protein